MYQIDNSSAAAVIPASTPAGTPGYFTDGNPATGVAPTILPAEFMNMVMLEILGVLSAAGVTPSKSNFTQLTTAIRAVNRQLTIVADTGTANTYTAANTPALSALPATGYIQRVNIAHLNTGASTYAPDGLAAKPVYGLGLQSLQGGELPIGIASFMYLVQAGVNGGNGAWIILESLGGAAQIAPGTGSSHAATLAQLQSGYGSFAIDTGTANTYVCAFTPAITARAEGQVLRFKVKTTNSGASTINDGLGVVPLVGGAHAALQGGELVANGDALVQWNTSIGGGSYILLFCTGAAEQIAPATQSQHAIQLSQMAAVVGGVRNGKMSVTAASATATFTADEVAVKSALGGPAWLLSSFSKTINLATTGSGGMDTGTAPVSGFVAIYAIYNPTTATSALLAVNATSVVAPSVYGGANMPAGYTASALVGVWGTNASGQFVVGLLRDRRVTFPSQTAFNTTTGVTSVTSVSISASVPLNAIEVDVINTCSESSAGNGVVFSIFGSSASIDALVATAQVTVQTSTSTVKGRIMLLTPQTLYYVMGSTTAGIFTLQTTGFTF